MSVTKNDLQKKLGELAALRKIIIAINSNIGDLDSVLNLILTNACDLIDARHGSLMLLQPENQSLRIAAVVGADWTPEKQACLLGFGEGITGRVAATGEPYLCLDTKTDQHYFPLFENVVSELAVPVISQGKVLGVINFDSERMAAFTSGDMEMLSLLADHAAIAIENARQYGMTRASRERWLRIFDALPVAAAVCDPDFLIEWGNKRFWEMFNISSQTGIGNSFGEVIQTFGVPKPNETWKECLSSGQPIRHSFLYHEKKYQMAAIRVSEIEKPVYLISFSELS